MAGTNQYTLLLVLCHALMPSGRYPCYKQSCGFAYDVSEIMGYTVLVEAMMRLNG